MTSRSVRRASAPHVLLLSCDGYAGVPVRGPHRAAAPSHPGSG
jgi:hypothetical protein